MRCAALILCLVLFVAKAATETAAANKAKSAAIQAAENVLISTFDSSLPRISLEYFLNYEGAGAPVEWQLSDCPSGEAPDGDSNHSVCVEATVIPYGMRTVTVLIAVQTLGKGPSRVALRSVTFTDETGVVRHLRLIDVPAAIHGTRPKLPRDLPPIVGSLPS